MEQYYKIAGLTVKMDTFGRTLHQAEPYLTQETQADMTICPDTPAVAARNPGMNASHVEYLAPGADFYAKLPSFGGMLLHSSCVVVDGQAYLFTAPRKMGKSTHVRLWLREFGERAHILNDDKPALRYIDGVWYACGTPWSGKSGQNTNEMIPIKAIAVLGRDTTTHIEPFAGPEVVKFLIEQTVIPTDPVQWMKLLDMLDSLLKQASVWKLYCNMEQSAARIAYEAMSADKENIV